MVKNIINDIPGLICFWDFNGEDAFVSKSEFPYQLKQGNTEVKILDEGPVNNKSIAFKEGQFLYIKRSDCPALNIKGKDAKVTVLSWVKRKPKSYIQCEAIAGMWNETEKKRQYCLFLNIQLFESANQVCGHISGVGGSTTGQKWCIDASIGKQIVNFDEWTFAAFTYDANEIISYYNGEMDHREDRNPYTYKEGIFDGGEIGSDFTVAAVHRLGEMGNYFVGQISGLAVYNSVLNPEQINEIYNASKPKMGIKQYN
jgi:hypothetical protein